MTEQTKPEKVLWPIVERMMDSMIIKHALDKGATQEWIDSLADLNPATRYMVIVIIWGEPEMVKRINKDAPSI